MSTTVTIASDANNRPVFTFGFVVNPTLLISLLYLEDLTDSGHTEVLADRTVESPDLTIEGYIYNTGNTDVNVSSIVLASPGGHFNLTLNPAPIDLLVSDPPEARFAIKLTAPTEVGVYTCQLTINSNGHPNPFVINFSVTVIEA